MRATRDRGNERCPASVASRTGFRLVLEGKNSKVLLFVAFGLICWVAVSFAVAPLVGLALRRCDRLEQARAVAVLRAKAQHPATHAA